MKKKIGIMVDGSCTLTNNELKKFDAKRLDFRILNTNTNEEYKDTLEGLDQIVKKSLEKNEVFKTSCTPIGEIMVAMEEMLEDYEQIIVLPMHKCISSQYNNIKSEANEYPGKVFVIDATMMNNEINYFVEKIRELEKSEKSVEDIVEYINEESKKTATIFTVQSLTSLNGSGRFRTLFKILDKLKIFPVICLQHESPKLYGLGKNYNKAIAKMVEKFMKENNIDDIKKIELMAFYDSLLDQDKMDYFLGWLAKEFNIDKKDITINKNPMTVTVYTGINAYGVSLRIKSDEELKVSSTKKTRKENKTTKK